ncbi:MAG: AAA family ATPase [Cystobacter sp.]
MWQRVSLRNYRSIEKADVVLAPFTVLVGTNGSGKSNFADALLLATEISFDAQAAIKRRGASRRFVGGVLPRRRRRASRCVERTRGKPWTSSSWSSSSRCIQTPAPDGGSGLSGSSA